MDININQFLLKFMSVYSGFATRKQETQYFELSQTLLQVLIRRILKFYKNEYCEEELFCESLKNIYASIYELEQYKHLDPKYSTFVIPLLKQLRIQLGQHNQIRQDSLHQPDTVYKITQVSPIKRRRLFSSKKSSISGDPQKNHDKIFTLISEYKHYPSKITGHIVKQNFIPNLNVTNPRIERTTGDQKLSTIRKHQSAEKYTKKDELEEKYQSIIENVMKAQSFKRKQYEQLRHEELQKFNKQIKS